jgi:hypothetical protein
MERGGSQVLAGSLPSRHAAVFLPTATFQVKQCSYVYNSVLTWRASLNDPERLNKPFNPKHLVKMFYL